MSTCILFYFNKVPYFLFLLKFKHFWFLKWYIQIDHITYKLNCRMLKTVYLLCKEKQTCYNTDKTMKNFHCRLVCSTAAKHWLTGTVPWFWSPAALHAHMHAHTARTYMYTYAHSKYAHTSCTHTPEEAEGYVTLVVSKAQDRQSRSNRWWLPRLEWDQRAHQEWQLVGSGILRGGWWNVLRWTVVRIR